MKKLAYFNMGLIIGFIAFFAACTSEKAHNSEQKIFTAKAYVAIIEDSRKCITTAIDTFIPTIDYSHADSIDKAYRLLEETCKTCADGVFTLSPFESDNELKLRADTLFKFYLSMLKLDYARLIQAFKSDNIEETISFTKEFETIELRKREEKILMKNYVEEKNRFEHKYY